MKKMVIGIVILLILIVSTFIGVSYMDINIPQQEITKEVKIL